VLTSTLVNNFRYGSCVKAWASSAIPTRIDLLPRLNDQTVRSRARIASSAAHTFADDVSWIRGKHTWQFAPSLFYPYSQHQLPDIFQRRQRQRFLDHAVWLRPKKSPLNPPIPARTPTRVRAWPMARRLLLPVLPTPTISHSRHCLEWSRGGRQYNFKRDGSALADVRQSNAGTRWTL